MSKIEGMDHREAAPKKEVERRLKIAFDIDDLLNDMTVIINDRWNTRTGSSWTLDQYTSYNFGELWGVSRKVVDKFMEKFFDSDDFRNLLPSKGAVKTVARLAKKHDLITITGRKSIYEGRTREWLDQYFPALTKDLHLTGHWSTEHKGDNKTKGEICAENGVDVIIEDSFDHAKNAIDNGTPDAILFSKRWNEKEVLPDNIHRVYNWKQLAGKVHEIAIRPA